MLETWTNERNGALPEWLKGRSMRLPGGELIVAVTSVDGEAPKQFRVKVGQIVYKNKHGAIGLHA